MRVRLEHRCGAQVWEYGTYASGIADMGTHWGNVRVMLGLYGDNGKVNGNRQNGVK